LTERWLGEDSIATRSSAIVVVRAVASVHDTSAAMFLAADRVGGIRVNRARLAVEESHLRGRRS